MTMSFSSKALLAAMLIASAMASPAKAEIVNQPVYGYWPTAAYPAVTNYYQPVSPQIAVNSRYAVPVSFSLPMQVPTIQETAVKSLNTRFGNLDIFSNKVDGLNHYSVNINGMPIVAAGYQSDRMVVSEVFKLVDEDVVIFTVDGDPNGCRVHNFMVALRSNGTYVGPVEIGDCHIHYQARIIDNGLLMEFPDAFRTNVMFTWRYKYGAMERI